MRVAKTDVPPRIDVPGAVARQLPGFGDPSGHGPLGAEYFSLSAGVDIAPLLQGLEGDACQAPHWGFMLAGRVAVTYTDGTEETCAAQDLFHWPPGHSVRALEDAEVILFSPATEHAAVLDHMLARLSQASTD
ncbi:MAG: hypothetical protein R2755_14150 [Acidimicrobiales bacterium]